MKRIKVILDRIEGDHVILIAPDRNEIQIPKTLIPKGKKGMIFAIEIKSEEEAKKSDEILAKAILNEILRNG
jgi:hypothetical protein